MGWPSGAKLFRGQEKAMAYAKGTDVSVEKTEIEIKQTLRRYGATSFASFDAPGSALIAFEMSGRRVAFRLPLPSRDDRKFAVTRTSNQFTDTPEKRAGATHRAWEQACRERWRALLLCIKAKLESVESGIETFEDAFLAHIQMPDGLTVGEHVRPRIKQVYDGGEMTPLLPPPPASMN
jgi:hypothetical protein